MKSLKFQDKRLVLGAEMKERLVERLEELKERIEVRVMCQEDDLSSSILN